MSVKIKIKQKELEQLTFESINAMFVSHNEKFELQKYLLERYSRSKEVQTAFRQIDSKELDTITPLESYLVDVATGYGIGKPVTYYDKSDDNFKKDTRKDLYNNVNEFVVKLDQKKENVYLSKYLDIMSMNQEHAHNIKLLRRALITGSADEMVFMDSGVQSFSIIEDDCIALYSTTVKPKLIGFIRKVVYKSPLNPLPIDSIPEGGEDCTYELYTENGNFRYLYGGIKELITDIIIPQGEIPFVVYDIEESYISKLIPSIRSYELVTNNTKKILNYNDDAILVLKGYDTNTYEKGEDEVKGEIKDIADNIKSSGIILIDSEDDSKAEWLTKTLNDATNQNHKVNLKDDIYTLAGTFNPANDNAVYQNTLSLMFKMYGLETKMSEYLAVFYVGFKERCDKITKLINLVESSNFKSSVIDMTFSRNMPTNMNEELNLMNQGRDMLSLRKIYEMTSFIENPDKEIEAYKQWQLEKEQIEIEKANIRAKATEGDMTGETTYPLEDNVKDDPEPKEE